MQRSAGMGGGAVIRAVGRAVTAGATAVKGAPSSSSARPARPSRVATVSSSPPSPSFATSASGAGRSFASVLCDSDEWEAVGGAAEADDGVWFADHDRFVFGPAPSKEEAEVAVSTLQQIFVPVSFSEVIDDGNPPFNQDASDGVTIGVDKMEKASSSAEPESDWIEPALQLYNSPTSQSQGRGNVLDALHLLQINPSVQRMVVSLSSDKAVWDAVMNNDVVQEFKKSFYEVKDSKPQEPEDSSPGFLTWIVNKAKEKMEGFFDMVTKLMNGLFHSQEQKGKKLDFFDEALRSSFMLSIAVFIIVVASRIQKG